MFMIFFLLAFAFSFMVLTIICIMCFSGLYCWMFAHSLPDFLGSIITLVDQVGFWGNNPVFTFGVPLLAAINGSPDTLLHKVVDANQLQTIMAGNNEVLLWICRYDTNNFEDHLFVYTDYLQEDLKSLINHPYPTLCPSSYGSLKDIIESGGVCKNLPVFDGSIGGSKFYCDLMAHIKDKYYAMELFEIAKRTGWCYHSRTATGFDQVIYDASISKGFLNPNEVVRLYNLIPILLSAVVDGNLDLLKAVIPSDPGLQLAVPMNHASDIYGPVVEAHRYLAMCLGAIMYYSVWQSTSDYLRDVPHGHDFAVINKSDIILNTLQVFNSIVPTNLDPIQRRHQFLSLCYEMGMVLLNQYGVSYQYAVYMHSQIVSPRYICSHCLYNSDPDRNVCPDMKCINFPLQNNTSSSLSDNK